MNRSIIALIAMLAFFIPAAADTGPVTLDEAKSLALTQNKLILADFFAEW